ncbi:MAG: type II toxin-antitoxin system RelE/ParE family toxin [Proteobacteria bacterium]|nr:type II toxin-antitoxin system RelE/ParE family toxin [Pseudomonadota bacterium]NOG61156.1 type II toxin-antitoxin system RelE/ParE family toxin [Pseudomonadota bacterium]
MDQITQHVELLADHPKQGKIVLKYQREDIREIYEGSYRIIYLIRSDQIDILTIRHTSSLLPKILSKL